MAASGLGRCSFGFSNGQNGGHLIVLVWISLFVAMVSSKEYCNGQFKRCLCTDTKVECHNETELTDITTLYQHIKDHIISFTITGSRFTELQINFLGSCERDSSLELKELLYLDLSGNMIELIHEKTFHCMPNLQMLNLSHNNWKIGVPREEIGYFTSLPELMTLDLTNAFYEVLYGSIHISKLASVFENADMSKLETLKLGYNELHLFSEAALNSLCNLNSLKELDLSHNNLMLPPMPKKLGCFEKLEILDLSHNSIRDLPTEFIQMIEHLTGLKLVKLDNNPFDSDGFNRETLRWLSTTEGPVNTDDLRFTSGYHSYHMNKTVLEVILSDQQRFVEELNNAARSVTGGSCTMLGVMLLTVLFVENV